MNSLGELLDNLVCIDIKSAGSTRIWAGFAGSVCLEEISGFTACAEYVWVWLAGQASVICTIRVSCTFSVSVEVESLIAGSTVWWDERTGFTGQIADKAFIFLWIVGESLNTCRACGSCCSCRCRWCTWSTSGIAWSAERCTVKIVTRGTSCTWGTARAIETVFGANNFGIDR